MDRRRFLSLTGGTGLALGLTGTALAGSAEAAGYPYFNRRIPSEAHTKMGELAPYGITSFSFTPGNGWVIVTKTGGYFARNIPDECYTKLGEMVAAGNEIHCIAFPPEGGNRWVITGSKGLFARNIPDECYQKIVDYYDAGQQVVHVAFPPAGGNRWTVVTNTGNFFARGINDECYQMMRNLSQGGRKVTRVAFPYTGGWTVIAQDVFHARGIDQECFEQMHNFDGAGWQLHNVAFSPVNNGWSISTRGQVPVLPADKIRQVENSVGGKDIWQRLADYKTPGAAIAVVVNNQIAWSTGYGWLEAGGSAAVHPESAFQAASLSKAVASVGFMRHIQNTAVELTTDVRPHLNWTLDRRACVGTNEAPTLDRLLAHRAGVIGRGSTSPANVCTGFGTGGGGFPGYGAGATVPTLLQVMNGQGNTGKIELTTTPGSEYHYSGQGFVLLQRMLEQRTGLTLDQYMQDEVFTALGMNTSSYALYPSFELASGHFTSGSVIDGKRYRYPESAAAGLYTNVQDLGRMIRWLNRAFMAPGDITGPLNRNSVQTMLTTGPTMGIGRGFFLSNTGTNNFSYGHGGDNRGFKAEFRGYPNLSGGYAVMVNGDNGDLVGEIAASIKSAYGWS